MSDHESYHASVRAQSYVLPVSDEMLAEAQATQSAIHRWMAATPEERERWAEEARAERAERRRATDRRPLTLDALIDSLGFEREYAEHLVQPYCECGDGMDGWDYCQHARDEGFVG